MVGAAGLRAGLAAPAREALEEAVSSLYQPFDPAAAPTLLRESAAGAHLLLLAPMPGVDNEVAWLWRNPDGEVRVDVQQLDPEAVELLGRLGRRGMDRAALPADVVTLTQLLPEGLGDAVERADDGLVIVALGELWSVPWPAVPLLGGRLLGETARLAIAPSLTVYERIARRPPRRQATDILQVACWRSQEVDFHDLEVFDDPPWRRRNLVAPWAAREAVTSGLDDLVVVAGHGLSLNGTGHYLELAPGEPLTPADFLGATAPEQLVLIACWGAATPASGSSDPLTLGTMALASGARQVAATVAELGDNLQATRFVELMLEALPEHSMSAALRDATAAFLEDPRARDGPLLNWAPLLTIGNL